MTGTAVVPFGKYRGQPVAALAADRDYCDWLAAQPWFRERYRDVYNVVINMPGEEQDTPEHNALQARFLDDALCLALWRKLPRPNREGAVPSGPPVVASRSFEFGGIDVLFRVADGASRYRHPLLGGTIAVECKPEVGDDYPSILRQVLRTAVASRRQIDDGIRHVLVTRAYTGAGATLEQVRTIYRESGVHFLLLADFEPGAAA